MCGQRGRRILRILRSLVFFGVFFLDQLLCAEISAALREALCVEGISAPKMDLQGFGDVSVRPVVQPRSVGVL